MKSSRGFLLKRHSFTKLQSSKKLWSTYCTPTAHELALSSLNSSSPVCSMMHGVGEYSYTTINQELDHVFLLFPQRRCGFLFGTWSSAKKNHRDRSSYHKAKILLQREMQKPENFWHTTRSMQHRLILKWLKFFFLLYINAVADTEEEVTVGFFIRI